MGQNVIKILLDIQQASSTSVDLTKMPFCDALTLGSLTKEEYNFPESSKNLNIWHSNEYIKRVGDFASHKSD